MIAIILGLSAHALKKYYRRSISHFETGALPNVPCVVSNIYYMIAGLSHKTKK
jgi:hypothetical protein